MSKQDEDKAKARDEEEAEEAAADKDEDEQDEGEDEGEGEGEDEDEDEDEVEAAPPPKRAARPQARRREPAPEEDAVAEEPEDPYWWTPHAVLSALVLIGLLGFFGVFNNTPLARIAAPVAPAPDDHHEAPASAPATPPPVQPQQRPGPDGTAQPPREMFGAKHLLVMYKGSRRAPPTIERTKEEAQARATEAMKKAKAEPAKFADFVKEYSDEPGAGNRGGDLGKFPKGAMVPEFQAALEKLKVGDVSDLVETPFGFHVILRTQ